MSAEGERARGEVNGTDQRGSQILKTNSWISKTTGAACSLTLNASNLLSYTKDTSLLL